MQDKLILSLSKLEAEALFRVLKVTFELGSYDSVFPTQASENRVDKMYKILSNFLFERN